MKHIPVIEIILPVFNEEKCIPVLVEQLDRVQDELRNKAELQYMFVNDASTDGTSKLLERLHSTRNNVRVFELVRNYGHGGAINCGIDQFRGDIAVFMDADLQDSPEVILEMFSKWLDGSKTIVAERLSRKERIRFIYHSFYFLLDRIAKMPSDVNFGTFCMLDNSVVERMRLLKERNRYFPGLVGLSSGPIAKVRMHRHARAHGTSRMGFRRQVQLAIIALVSYSNTPIRMVTFLGIVSFLGGMAGAITFISMRVFTDLAIPGWASTMTSINLFGGVQLFCMGIIGEYVARIYDEVRGRPLYLVSKELDTERNPLSLAPRIAAGPRR